MESSENAIEVINVSKHFKVYFDKGNELKERMLFWKRNKFELRKVLDNISFSIKKGEAVGLVGKNGCGKSTLIKIISGVYQRDSGTIEFDGEVLNKITPIDAIMKGIQVIYQDFSIFPNLTVMENLAINSQLAANKKTVNWKEMRKIAEEAIAKINFKVDLDARLGTLSVA